MFNIKYYCVGNSVGEWLEG